MGIVSDALYLRLSAVNIPLTNKLPCTGAHVYTFYHYSYYCYYDHACQHPDITVLSNVSQKRVNTCYKLNMESLSVVFCFSVMGIFITRKVHRSSCLTATAVFSEQHSVNIRPGSVGQCLKTLPAPA